MTPLSPYPSASFLITPLSPAITIPPTAEYPGHAYVTPMSTAVLHMPHFLKICIDIQPSFFPCLREPLHSFRLLEKLHSKLTAEKSRAGEGRPTRIRLRVQGMCEKEAEVLFCEDFLRGRRKGFPGGTSALV